MAPIFYDIFILLLNYFLNILIIYLEKSLLIGF